MPLGPKSTEQIPDCKLKRVYPRLPLRVHSAGAQRLSWRAAGYPPQSTTAVSFAKSGMAFAIGVGALSG